MNTLPILVLLALALVALGIYVKNLHETNTRLKRDNDYYTTTYLRKQGGTSMWKGSGGKMVNYELRSFDAGKTWYAVERHGELGEYLTILGKAEVVYPGLMDSLRKMDALIEHVEKNGPLTFKSDHDMQLLKDIGFQVEVKDKATQ
jgi:hypothetical protein